MVILICSYSSKEWLFDWYLVNPLLMASAFEIRLKEFAHNFVGFFRRDETSRHDEHVGIVVLACQSGYLGLPAEGGTDALVLVQRHTDTFTASADGNSRIALSGFNG